MIAYLNTDLDLVSPDDPTSLVTALESGGLMRALHPPSESDGRWFVMFEAEEDGPTSREPQTHIAAMLTAIEALSGPQRAAWDRCPKRELNLGFDRSAEQQTLAAAIPPAMLARMAAAGVSLQLTLYPHGDDDESS